MHTNAPPASSSSLCAEETLNEILRERISVLYVVQRPSHRLGTPYTRLRQTMVSGPSSAASGGNLPRKIAPRPNPVPFSSHESAHHIHCSRLPLRRGPRLLPSVRATGDHGLFSTQQGPVTNLEIQDIHRSLQLLHQRVEHLQAENQVAYGIGGLSRATEQLLSNNIRSYVFNRTRQFACRAATRALLDRESTKELRKIPRQICAANSVRQIISQSRAFDCSLFEFKALAEACISNKEIHCRLVPSPFFVLNLHATQASHMQISFATYYDFCSALDIDITTRQRGLYKEQKDRMRVLRAVQVLGIEQRCGASSDSSAPQRRIFPAVSNPGAYNSSDGEEPLRICLFQDSAIWSENSWDSGFVSRFDAPVRFSRRHSGAKGRTSRSSHSDLNKIIEGEPIFSLIWRKTDQMPHGQGSSEECCLGQLRATIPAVVIRGRTLAMDTQSIFNTRIQGKYLTDMLISPPQ